MGRWFLGCPAYQSGPRKDGFRIHFSMASQSSFSRSLFCTSTSSRKRSRKRWPRCHRNVDPETVLPRTGLIRETTEKPSAHFTTAKTYVGTHTHTHTHTHTYIYIPYVCVCVDEIVVWGEVWDNNQSWCRFDRVRVIFF